MPVRSRVSSAEAKEHFFTPIRFLTLLSTSSRVMLPDYVILGGGSRSIKIKVSPQIFRLTPNTTIIEDLAFEQHQTTTG
jgi:hypothetical protein